MIDTLGQQRDPWHIDGVPLDSRFLIGTAGYPSPQILCDSIVAARSQVVTVGLRRQLAAGKDNGSIDMVQRILRERAARLLPNTAGCRTAREAVQLAFMAREMYGTSWIKLEVVGDENTLQPDMHELECAARQLVREGFTVLPYCTDDLVGCRRLLDAGCAVLMPWAAPIGSGRGLLNPHALRTLRERLPDATLIVDAGIGAPSQAARAMEMGFDAVLLNSAVAHSIDPPAMARAFRLAIEAGRSARLAGLMPINEMAVASTPVGGFSTSLGGLQ